MRLFNSSAVLTSALTTVVLASGASAQLATQDLNSGLTPEELVMNLLGEEILISNVTYTGVGVAAGTFTGGDGIIGFDSGVVLSSGNIASVVGPNVGDGTSTSNGQPGDPDLSELIPGFGSQDAACLEFDFECENIQVISFQYVFTSEEYNEYVDSFFNDVFGFFVNGVNVALLPDGVTPVAINNVNCGNPYVPGGGVNCEFFINNDLDDGGGAVNTEMDGLTVVLTVETPVAPGVNHIKLCIADAGDTALDSNVFIKSGSFFCAPAEPDTCDACEFGSVVTIDDEGDMVAYGTIQMAANAAAVEAGIQTVVVCDGYYEESVLVRDVHGVDFIACGDVMVNAITVKLSSDVSFDGFNVSANGRRAFWLNGGPVGAYGNQGVSILNCSIHDASNQGIRIDPGNSDVLVEGCSIHHNGHGIKTFSYGGALGGNTTVRTSVISDNLYTGVRFGTDMMVVLEENEIVNNGWYGIGRVRLAGSGTPETLLLLSNVLGGNMGYPIPGMSDSDVQNFDQVIDFADTQTPYTP